ncbi:hypothetical protein Hanom_Chr01g00019181 [Helianthus anomalus]
MLSVMIIFSNENFKREKPRTYLIQFGALGSNPSLDNLYKKRSGGERDAY